MPKIPRYLLLMAPFAVLVCYGWLVGGFSRYLDRDLLYVRPHVAVAAEDVLGLGFWPTWFLALLALGTVSALSYRFATRRRTYYVVVGALFLILTALDMFLYRTLEQQVLAQ